MLTELPDKSGVISFSFELESNSTDIYYQHAAQCDSQFLYYKTDYPCVWSNGGVLYNSCLLWINLLKKMYVKTIFVIEIWNITVRDFNIPLTYKIQMDYNNENCGATNNSRDDDPWGENDPTWDQTFIPRFNMLSPR